MKRIIFEVILILGLAGAGAFGYLTYKKGATSSTELATLTAQSEETGKKLEDATAELEKLQKELPGLQAKALQLDALREALAGGQTLSDLEAAYKREKSLSPERHAGLGALRLLTRGGSDPGTLEAFKKALDAADWGSRRNLICASQKALASAGQDVKVLSECLPEGLTQMPQAGGKAPEKAADKPAEKAADKPAEKAQDKPAEKAADKPAEKAAGKGQEDTQVADAGTLQKVQWDYEGEMGPDNWGKRFPMCERGRMQAPLDIRGPFEKTRIELSANYKNAPLRIVNTGRTIQVNVPPGSRLRIDSMPYDLLYFHFHRPSEELVEGQPSAMGVRFVHRNKDGKIAVLGVLLREGNENPGIKTLWQHAPKQEGPEVEVAGVNFNPGNLLPRNMAYWRYEGSATTPPCNEGILYYILKEPVNIAREQVLEFPFKRNARPVQPQNGRNIASS